MKKIFAVLAGLICAVIVFSLFEFISSLIYPFPKNLDLTNTEALQEFMSTVPPINMIIILIGYALGSVLGGFAIRKINPAENKVSPLIAGGILTIAGIINLNAIPHPVWFMVINLLIYIPLVLLGHALSQKKDETSGSYH